MFSLTLWLGPVAALLVGSAVGTTELGSAAAVTAGVATLCAVWWVTEPIPIPATSLIPLAMFPVTGVVSSGDVGKAYGHPLILLLLGGFILSTALERCGVHRRLALAMVRLCTHGPGALFGVSDRTLPEKPVTGRRLVIGFMAASAAISMWVSNAATTLMLLPIAAATLEKSRDSRLRVALLLGIAYAASVGGVGTPIGTPPNVICMQEYQALTGEEPTFAQWMTWGVPVAATMIPVIALWLTRNLGGAAEIDLPESGPWRPAEWRTLAVFGVTALLWVTRKEPFGGWSGYWELPGATDATVALLAVVVLFMIPNGEPPETPDGPLPRLLDWETAARIPWGMLLLFSGGMVLAAAFKASGLSTALGEAMGGLAALPTPVLIAGLCLMVTFMTEVTSNTATTALLMPLLGATAQASDLDPRLLMFPAAVSASFAFMLPVATVPNAAVYGAGVATRDMAREGFVLNLLGVVVVTVLGSLLLS
ncbi:Sodium-dependent dicarboxylate transporter SdcS [Planctomycetes bacterium MalM25]|nr:Sodium-dependent dicarboxylate transporter SdcS [Planctomycetes bacterium MalM25]